MNNDHRKVLAAALKKRQAEKKKGTYTSFDALTRKLEGQGKTADQAKGIAAIVGRKHFGKAGFAALGQYGKQHKAK